MVTRYPAAIDTVFTLKPILDGQPVTGGSVEQLRVAIIAIEDELGVKPSGVYATVRNRLDVIEGAVGNLRIIELEGDLGGTLETPKMIGIQGRPVSDVAPIDGQTLIWNGIAWIPGAIPAEITFAGDLTGTSLAQTVVGINATPVTTTDSANNGDVLTVQKTALDPATFTKPQAIANDGTHLWVGNQTIKAIDKITISNKQSVHIDLTAFMPGGSNVFPRKVVVDTALSPYVFVACMDAFRVLIINRETNAVIGIGDTVSNRARSLTLDNLGNVWVGTHSGNATVQRFVIADVISSFPTPQSAQSQVSIAKDAEEIIFDGTNIWAVGSSGDIDRINPTGNGTNTGTFNSGTRWLADVVSAFGSIWVLNQGNPPSVEKINPNTFPSAAVDVALLPDSEYLRTMEADNGFLWVPDTLPGKGTKLFKLSVDPLTVVAGYLPPGDEQAYFELVPDAFLDKIYIAVNDATDSNNLGVRTFDTSINVFTTNYNKLDITGLVNLHYAPPTGGGGTTLPDQSDKSTFELESADIGWGGASGIVFDGNYIWVADADSSGSNNTVDPRSRFLRVFNPGTSPPTLVANIDLTPWLPMSIARSVTLSNDGTKVYVCIKGWPGPNNVVSNTSSISRTVANGPVKVTTSFSLPGDDARYDPPRLSVRNNYTVTISNATGANNGTFNIIDIPITNISFPFSNTFIIDNPYAPVGNDPGNAEIIVTLNKIPGRVLIFDTSTFELVGNAELISGPIGDGSPSAGARHAIDIGTGVLYVNNSNQSTGNIIEKFDLQEVLANGSAATKSFGFIDTPDHSEELYFDGTFIWTAGWAYSQTLKRIDPSDDSIVTWNDPNYFVSGGFPAFGSIWCGGFDEHILRFDPNTFPSAPIVITTDPSRTMGFIRGGFTTDGTYVWVPDTSGSAGKADQAKVDPNTNTVAAYVTVQDPGDNSSSSGGLQEMCFDGTNIWGTRRFNSYVSFSEVRPSSLVQIDPVAAAVKLIWPGADKLLVWSKNQVVGDLAGVTSGPKVTGIQGRPVTSIAPLTGQGLVWDGTYWKPGTVGGSLGGDVTGPTGTNTVVQITGVSGNINILASKQTSVANVNYQPFSEQATFVATGAFDTIYGNYLVPASTGVQIDVVVTAIDSTTSNFASWKLSYGALRTNTLSAAPIGSVPAPAGVAPDRFSAGASAWISTVSLAGNQVLVKGQASSGVRWGISFQALPVTP